MPKASKKSATKGRDHGAVADREEDLTGYTVNFVEFRQDIDGTPLMVGLPDNRCQCPHWGYVLKGKMTMRFADREEVYEAGDAFYAPPGHVPVRHEPGTEIVQFSPGEELHKTQAVIMKNVAAMQGG
jgi:mannose-6-phosphate isomerase-like protein (cupin superfamily)